MLIERHKAAIHRHELSKPIRLALADGIVRADRTVFDFGCGHGDDVRLLAEQNINACGWDAATSEASAAQVLSCARR